MACERAGGGDDRDAVPWAKSARFSHALDESRHFGSHRLVLVAPESGAERSAGQRPRVRPARGNAPSRGDARSSASSTRLSGSVPASTARISASKVATCVSVIGTTEQHDVAPGGNRRDGSLRDAISAADRPHFEIVRHHQSRVSQLVASISHRRCAAKASPAARRRVRGRGYAPS